MNITEIYTHPKFSMSAMVRRMAERHKEKNLDKAIKTIQRFSVDNAERVAEALMEADGIPREVVTELDRLMDLTDEDLFPGDCA